MKVSLSHTQQFVASTLDTRILGVYGGSPWQSEPDDYIMGSKRLDEKLVYKKGAYSIATSL